MKTTLSIIVFLFFLLITGCIVEFIPKTNADDAILVVEGLITDQPRIYTVKLSKSLPLWKSQYPQPLRGSKVWISDDLGKVFNLKETTFGTYKTDSLTFRGVVGRTYTLNITSSAAGSHNYKSAPVEMKPVPPIDSIYYEKKTYAQSPQTIEGCQIFLDTHDPANNCKFFRWEYSETWEFHLILLNITNRVCWISKNSEGIFIKNASILSEDRITRFPLYSITNPIDRLSVKYSILAKQFSLNEDEFHYWESLNNMSQKVGGLYDIIPANIPSNIYCVESPTERVLGYFCVSAMSSKRLFIKDNFAGMNTMYARCFSDTIFTARPDTIPGFLTDNYIINTLKDRVPPAIIYTNDKGCLDCTWRGTNIKPAFWNEGK